MVITHQNSYYLILVLIMGTLWGFQFAMLKITAVADYSEISVLFISLVWLALVFAAILFYRKKIFTPSVSVCLFFMVSSFLGYTAPLLAALYAAKHLSTGMITLIVSFTPVVTVILVVLLKTERISINKILAIVIAMISAILVLWPQLTITENTGLKWLIIAVLAPLCYGVDSIYIHRFWPKNLDAWQVVAGECMVAALMLAPLYLFYAEPILYSPQWPEAQWAILLFILAAILEVLLFFYLIEKTGALLVSFGSVITLFAGVIWGMLLFSERYPVSTWAAMALLAVALIVVALEKASFEQNKVATNRSPQDRKYT